MANNVWDIKTHLQVQYYTAGVWTSVEADTYEVSIDRGVMIDQSVFVRPDSGTLQVRMQKSSLSDLVTGPAYKSNMPIRVRYQPLPDTQPTIWNVIFYGYISNVAMQYMTEAKILDITISADDSTKLLMNTRLPVFDINSTTGKSFRNVMGELATKIFAQDSRLVLLQSGTGGSATFQDYQTWVDEISGTILNQCLDAELGWVFADKSAGNQFYCTRTDINTKQATTWNNSNMTVSNVHTSSVDHICMDHMDLSFDTDTLVNSVKVEHSLTNIVKTAKNTTSITNYGEWPQDFSIQMDTGASPYTRLQDWADHVAAAADPKAIRSVSCPALRRDGTTSKIANVEIADTLQVEFVDPVNTSNKIQQVALISRINHEITADHWEVNLGIWKGI